ncbi:MAG TPA: class I tRNA ligase family protein, partial [Candidatus Saccharimonadales bacterium]|nr:class I tRNA ligase family protein [Candidatus Saccharimonadales bacterium]
MILFNSLSKKLEEFKSIEKDLVKMYVCGITPYDTTHLGHAFTYLSFDALIRYLKYKGNKVIYTQNVTDINDRDNDILKRAEEQNTTWQNLSKFWTDKFLNNMQNLNWIKPDNFLFASEQVSSMIQIIEKLLKNGCAYEVNNGIYLNIDKKKDFGKLSGFDEKKMLTVAKDFDEDLDNQDKRNKLDITLWRPTNSVQGKHIPSFESPFGPGRPGWHLECSAMAIGSLGEQIDIHGGGEDLIYPHHESEIAQSEGASGKVPFAKFWLHTGTVGYKGKKMSKSLGNLVLVSDLLKKYSANS